MEAGVPQKGVEGGVEWRGSLCHRTVPYLKVALDPTEVREPAEWVVGLPIPQNIAQIVGVSQKYF